MWYYKTQQIANHVDENQDQILQFLISVMIKQYNTGINADIYVRGMEHEKQLN